MPVDRKFHPRIGDSEKIARLTDMEFRVWFTYVMAADDFGVLPMVPAKIKAGDRTLANRKPLQIERALQTLVNVGLVRQFEHQGAVYVWSANWQEHQEIRYPRREQTYFPAPPEVELVALDGNAERSTRELFATFHMRVSEAFRARFGDPEALTAIAARELKRSRTKPRRSRDIPAMVPERFGDVATLTRARPPETANGSPVLEDQQERVFASERLDVKFRDFQAAYPAARRKGGPRVEAAFVDAAVQAGGSGPLFEALANHVASAEWLEKPNVIPGMDTWFTGEYWRQRKDPPGVAAVANQPGWVKARQRA